MKDVFKSMAKDCGYASFLVKGCPQRGLPILDCFQTSYTRCGMIAAYRGKSARSLSVEALRRVEEDAIAMKDAAVDVGC